MSLPVYNDPDARPFDIVFDTMESAVARTESGSGNRAGRISRQPKSQWQPFPAVNWKGEPHHSHPLSQASELMGPCGIYLVGDA